MRQNESTAAYFSRRSEAENAAADAAATERARELHRELAGLYRRRSDDLAGGAAAA